jgi:hypothetical protein
LALDQFNHSRSLGGATTLGIMTLSIMTFGVMKLSTKGLFVALSICDTQHNNANCSILFIVMLSVVMLSVVMLSVVMLRVVMLSVSVLNVVILSVVMLSVLAPIGWQYHKLFSSSLKLPEKIS